MTREEKIAELIFIRDNYNYTLAPREVFDDAIKALENQKTGHWIMTGDYYTGAYGCIDYVKCSCCNEDSLEKSDYCPNCGANMKGE